MKKILIDKFVPYDENPFEGIATLTPTAPTDFTPEAVRDADALIVRTRTRCGAPLLEGSNVRFVGTATIGTDHFDKPWLESRGIQAVSAPGCNAPAVAQYVLASIFSLSLGQPGMRLGIVGVGHVGSIVASWATALGMDVLLCDPPRQRAEHGWNPETPALAGDAPFVSLQEIGKKADVVTFHTPLTREGIDCSWHLLSDEFLRIAPKALVINAARGPVADTAALIRALRSGRVDKAAIDVWEGEPKISVELMNLAAIATPHIAGYSVEGKRRATVMVFNRLLEFFGVDRRMEPGVAMTPPVSVPRQAIIDSYDPLTDSLPLRRSPDEFERLRDTYPLRHEVKV